MTKTSPRRASYQAGAGTVSLFATASLHLLNL